jgi:cobalt-zinc-cadmium efflux system outer membrane protein
MNLKILVLSFISVSMIVPATGQQGTDSGPEQGSYYPMPDSLAQLVIANNRSMKTAREAYSVATLEAGTGNTPPNPEVQLGYLFGKPAEIGNRIDFAVTQEIDFPTSYIHRSRARDLKIAKAALTVDLTRQELLLQTARLWIERVYLNRMEKMVQERLSQADKLLAHYRQQLSVGEIGQLAFSQSNLQSASLKGELSTIKAGIRQNQVALEEITGNTGMEVKDTLLPPSQPIDPDSLKSAYMAAPLMQYFKREVDLTEQKRQLATSLSLPKISAGYYSESVLTEQFRGFQVGITLPLWEHSNRIKLAKSEVVFAEADAERMASQLLKEVNQLIGQWESLRQIILELEEALSQVNDMELLNLAWEQGEISLAEYMVGSDLYFRNLQSLWSYRKDLLMVEAELHRVYY